MKFKYILSLSGGKDSVALLLWLLEHKDKYPLDEVITCNMQEWEYDCIESVINKCKELCIAHNITFTQLNINMNNFSKYSWCGSTCRWGTTLKTETLKKYYNTNYKDYIIVEYLGYAKGEEKRINRQFENTIKIYPLIENDLTENDCLVMCYKHHIHWIDDGKELYDYLDRVSCKYCRNKNLKELEAIYKHFPKYWEQLHLMQQKTHLQYYKRYSLEQLEHKFNNVEIQAEQQTIFDYLKEVNQDEQS